MLILGNVFFVLFFVIIGSLILESYLICEERCFFVYIMSLNNILKFFNLGFMNRFISFKWIGVECKKVCICVFFWEREYSF